jgi:CRP/FNR family transcriptional regulator, cyclic AMP receptor protein
VIGDDQGAFLARTPLFRGLPARAIEVAASVVRVRSFPAETLLFQEGDPGDALYVLAAGLVKISKVDLGGHEKTLAMMRPPAFFGEMALLSGARRSASAITLEPSTCLLLFDDDFRRLLSDYPALNHNLTHTLIERLRGMDDESQVLSYQDAQGRVAYVLLRLHRDGVVDILPDRFRVRLTHQDVANLAGTSRETVTRALKALEADGMIETRPKEIDLLNLPGLEEILHGVR